MAAPPSAPATPAPLAIAPAATSTTVAIAPTVTSIVSALGVANAFSEAFNHSGSRTLMSIYSDDVILTLGSRFPLERTTGLAARESHQSLDVTPRASDTRQRRSF